MTHQIIQYGIFTPIGKGNLITEVPLLIVEGTSYKDVLSTFSNIFSYNGYLISGTHGSISLAWNDWEESYPEYWRFLISKVGLPNLPNIVYQEQEDVVRRQCPMRDKDGNVYNIEGSRFLNGRIVLPSTINKSC